MPKKNKQIRWICLNISFLICLSLIVANLILNPNLLKFINLDGLTNDFCQSLNNTSNSTMDFLICDNKFKKKKIILLLVDGLPFDKLKDLTNFKKSKLPNFFRGEGLEYKQSGALFETIFSGKFSRNYLPSSPMSMDNLAKQLKNGGLDVFYKVKYFPVGILVDKKLGKKFELYSGELIPLTTFCDLNASIFEKFAGQIQNDFIDKTTLNFKEGLNVDNLYETAYKKLNANFEKIKENFNECFAQHDFSSIVYYTDAMDHIEHQMSKNYPLALYYIFFLENYVRKLIQWIDEEHSEYALALASDHGGQYYYGEDALCNHGCNNPGNEAVFFVYTKELREIYEKDKLDNVFVPIISMNDFSCTITQILKNVNLPLESTCTPRIIGNDNIFKYTSAKSKEVQLKKFIEKLSERYPKFKEYFYTKFYSKLENNKFKSIFKDIDSIYNEDDKIYQQYIDYLINIQTELNKDIIKVSQTKIYYFIYFISLISFILGFLYFSRKIILISREKVLKEIKKENNNKDFLKKITRYIYLLIIILIIEPIMCLIYSNSKNISQYINISIFAKFISLLIFVLIISFINNLYKKPNYKKMILVLSFIIIQHLIMSKIEFYVMIDKYNNTQAKSDFFKIWLSYPLFILYSCIELYNIRNYYISVKYKIRYIYIIIPYLIFICFYLVKFDLYLKLINSFHSPSIIRLMRKSYGFIFLILQFIMPLVKNNNINNEEKGEVPSVIINFKLFSFVLVSFICIETERVELILLYCFLFCYICHCYNKEKDMLLKIIYIIIIISLPEIHYIANQGTYTLDTSIKVTVKCPSKWADDLPIIMGLIFFVHKLRFIIIGFSYIFSISKITQKKGFNYFTDLVRLFYKIELFGMTICYLYFLKKEIEQSYIQVLFMVASKVFPMLLYDFALVFNYLVYRLLNWIFIEREIKKEDYNLLEQSETSSLIK